MQRYRSRASAHIDVYRPTSELQAEGTSSPSPTPLSRLGLKFGRNGATAWVKGRKLPASPSPLSRTARPGAALSTPADARDPGASRRPHHGRAEGPSTLSDLVPKRG